MKHYIKYLPYTILITTLISSLATLFFSEILHFPPCKLCWYQRIAMYPLVAISIVGILLKDKNLPYYLLPLSVSGLLISIYHNLLYYSIIPESLAPCQLGVSCTARFIQIFGFIDIPQGALISWILINIFVIIYIRYNKSK